MSLDGPAAWPADAPSDLRSYDFELPADQIADEAVEPRHAARLLCVSRRDGALRHQKVEDLPSVLPPGALLVVNDTRVVPARLIGHKVGSGGKVEILLSEPFADSSGDNHDHTGLLQLPALAKSNKPLRVGAEIDLGRGCSARISALRGGGEVVVDLAGAVDLDALLTEVGHLPLPPYLRRGIEHEDGRDRLRYQTMWARAQGAVAAPTAGLHFSAQLLDRLEIAGFERVAVTLHVGPGTFLPVRTDDLRSHSVAAERFEVSDVAVAAIVRARAEGRPVIAVGTTVCRTLETLGQRGLVACKGHADLTIVPGHAFKVVDGLMTNFHLPCSSLLLLVAAFAGYAPVMSAYRAAVADGYRFYSYGDASLWL